MSVSINDSPSNPMMNLPPIVSGIVFGKREIRRCSDPGRAQQLWDAIGAVRAQKQIPAITRMSRYMNRYYQVNKEETQRLLDAAVEDNLIKLERKIGTKGHKSGIEEKAYRLPTSDMLPRERHDWYCFHCHSGGEVLLCAGCHRVYHENCLKPESQQAIKAKKGPEGEDEDELEDDRQEWFCMSCQITQKVTEGFNKKERRDLNHLLKIVFIKLKSKLPASLLAREIPQPANKNMFGGDANSDSIPIGGTTPKPPGTPTGGATSDTSSDNLKMQQQQQKESQPKDEPWRINFLLKQNISLEEMEHKCNSNHYRVLEEFRVDVQLIVHNIVIFHGVHSNLADVARQMFRDCCTDLKEIQLCRDCFRYANELREKYWFCKPCRPFHELVYAKQKGFPYWPAKVVSSRGSFFEVRFFGGYHQKALVEKQHVKPISVNIHTLQVKRTSLWNKACEELRKHQEILTKCQSNEQFLREPFGDPFSGSSEIRSQFFGGLMANNNSNSNSASGTLNSDNDDDEEEEEELELDEVVVNKPLKLKDLQQEVKINSPVVAEYNHSHNQQQRQHNDDQDISDCAKELIIAQQKKMKRKGKNKRMKKEESSEDLVSSSSQQEVRFVNAAVQTPSKLLKKSEMVGACAGAPVANKPDKTVVELKQMIEKMRAEFDQEKKRAVNVATRSLERDLERLKADHATEIEEIIEVHKQEVSDNKKKQWCYHCEAEAIYWCCWNTAYCSTDCQQSHWHKEHKKNCRRKR